VTRDLTATDGVQAIADAGRYATMRGMGQAIDVDRTSVRAEPLLSYAIARLHQRVFAEITESLAPHGLTTLQFTTLSILHRHGAPLSTSQLARRAFMTPQSMSEVIHALERKELIKRNPHPNHRRTLPATLTAKGRRVLAACEAAVSELESTMLEGFSDRDREEFLAMIKAGVRNLGGGFRHD
jgi:DNA-binding MarR family transcriptional regulator